MPLGLYGVSEEYLKGNSTHRSHSDTNLQGSLCGDSTPSEYVQAMGLLNSKNLELTYPPLSIKKTRFKGVETPIYL